MHESIKKFSLVGEMDDGNIIDKKERLITFLEHQMRDSGIVPILDMEPQFTLNYIPEGQKYKFELSIYGTKVGKEAAWRTSGIMGGKTIARSTVRAR